MELTKPTMPTIVALRCETLQFLEQYRDALKFDGLGEVIDRLILQVNSTDPTTAMLIFQEQFVMITQNQTEKQLAQTIFDIIGFFACCLLQDGMDIVVFNDRVNAAILLQSETTTRKDEDWKSMSKVTQIKQFMKHLGLLQNTRSFKYLLKAIILMQQNAATVKTVWSKIAQQYGLKEPTLRSSVQRELAYAYRKNTDIWLRDFGELDIHTAFLDIFLMRSIEWLGRSECCAVSVGGKYKGTAFRPKPNCSDLR